MKIALASDHGGYTLKEILKKHLDQKGISYEDFGTDSEESVDYPIYGKLAANAVANGQCKRGILCCGTGIGIGIAANKVKGIRCAMVSDTFSARMSRAHNDANMLSLGARVIGAGLALEIVDIWLQTEFEGGRHLNRILQIEE